MASSSASNCIDDDPATVCRSDWQHGAWLSLRVSGATPFQYVALTNSPIANEQRWLGPIELWLGNETGRRGVKCGSATAPHEPGPFIVPCDSRSLLEESDEIGDSASGETIATNYTHNYTFLTVCRRRQPSTPRVRAPRGGGSGPLAPSDAP